MSTKTEAQLATAVLRELTVVDASEDPTGSDDALWVIGVYEDKFAEWASPGLELTYWSMTTIPAAIFNIIRDLIINEVVGTFGNPQPPAAKQQQEEYLLGKLRRHVSTESSGQPVQADYF